MAKIVNLRQARKARARNEKRAQADVSAAKHGRSASERGASEREAALKNKRLDGHHRSDTTGEDL